MHLWHVCLIMTKVVVEILGENSQLNNWVLNSVASCHMTQQVSDFIPYSLEYTEKHIEVADGHHITAKQKNTFSNKNV